jgi:hypothetical protein
MKRLSKHCSLPTMLLCFILKDPLYTMLSGCQNHTYKAAGRALTSKNSPYCIELVYICTVVSCPLLYQDIRFFHKGKLIEREIEYKELQIWQCSQPLDS